MSLSLIPQFGIFTDHELDRYRRCAVHYAWRIVGEQDAYEVANDVLLNYIEKGTHPEPGNAYGAIKNAVIDAIRRKFGDDRLPGHKDRHAIRTAASFDDIDDDDDRPLHDNLKVSVTPAHGQSELIARIEEMNLPPLHRGMLMLSALWGFTDVELAHAFGVTAARIGQIKRSAFFPAKTGEIPGRTTAFIQAHQDIAKLQERVRHLEIILQAKGIAYDAD